jgi:AhpD family alkylhydroperoxidase
MVPRFDYQKASPAGARALYAFSAYVAHCGLEHSLLELIKTRASQINGCAFCIDMHTKDARAAGETEQRLYALNAWRETDFYTNRERAALLWTESVTEITKGHVPDEVYEEVRKEFSEEELANLTLAVVLINGWNRIAIATRTVAGTYRPAPKPSSQS